MPTRAAPGAVGLGRIDPEHRDLAAASAAVALEDLDRRRLAGAVGAEEREDLAAVDLEVDPAHRLDIAVGLAQPATLIDRFRHGGGL